MNAIQLKCLPANVAAILPEECIKLVREHLSEHRWFHTIGVIQASYLLALQYNKNPSIAALAGLFHDFTKGFSNQEHRALISEELLEDPSLNECPDLFHAISSSVIARNYRLPEEAIQAIRWHTTGKPHMSVLDMILFCADYVEPNRPWSEESDFLRVKDNLKASFQEILKEKMIFTLKTGKMLHPDSLHCWNWISKENKNFT
jgi:predicted HD superfamily hydrolase involved in NAD metabolism